MSGPSTGWFVTPAGERVAEHRGLSYYTIGQRAGLSKALPGMTGRWFVAKKGVGATWRDILIVPGSDHPVLQCVELWSSEFNWIAGMPDFSEGMNVLAQVRHRMAPVQATVHKQGSR